MGELKSAKSWLQEDKSQLLHGGVSLNEFAEKGTPIVLDSAHDIRVRDIHSREYIDAVGGAVCTNCGYSRKPQH